MLDILFYTVNQFIPTCLYSRLYSLQKWLATPANNLYSSRSPFVALPEKRTIWASFLGASEPTVRFMRVTCQFEVILIIPMNCFMYSIMAIERSYSERVKVVCVFAFSFWTSFCNFCSFVRSKSLKRKRFRFVVKWFHYCFNFSRLNLHLIELPIM